MLSLGSSWLIRDSPFTEREDASLRPSFYPILIIDCVALSEQYVVELFSLPYFWGISSSPAAFLFKIFLRTEWSSSLVNAPSLMSNCLLIILVIGSFDTFGGFPSRFSKCCFQFYSFLLACSFQFCFCSALPSTHFVYCLPGYPRLSIFHQVSNLIYLILYVFCQFF